MFKSIVWSSTIDYPNQLSTVLFVGNCNWNCEYCYNRNLKNKPSIDFEHKILPRLIQRKDFINHIVISGGECTTYKELPSIIQILKSNNFIVGIHSNGSNYNMLKKIINDINFIGMDIKCAEYEKFITTNKTQLANIKKSIKLILNYNIEHEFRTTIYPNYFPNINKVIELALFAKQAGVDQLVLQEFQDTLNLNIQPYSLEVMKKIQHQCNTILPTILKGDKNEQIKNYT